MSSSNVYDICFAEPVFCPRDQVVTVVPDGTTITDFAKLTIAATKNAEDWDESFYVCDLGVVVSQFHRWTQELPRVQPYYAVKSNSLTPVIRTIAALGAGFDCASKNELNSVLKCGVDPSRVIFASTCKFASHICDARRRGVTMTTVDNEDELMKIKSMWPKVKIVLRIRTDDSEAEIKFYNKFGATVEYSKYLIRKAAELGLSMIGISFHVGGCTASAKPYQKAIRDSKDLFDFAKDVGFNFHLLDIGGGFPGSTLENEKIAFEVMAATIRNCLNENFPEQSGIKIIAEPGRIFPAKACSLVANIIAKKNTNEETAYYVGDSIFGAFSTGMFRKFNYDTAPVYSKKNEKISQTVIYGSTLAGMDMINGNAFLPAMDVGDWLIFKEVGSYGPCLSVGLNGLFTYKADYFAEENVMKKLKSSCPFPTLLSQTSALM